MISALTFLPLFAIVAMFAVPGIRPRVLAMGGALGSLIITLYAAIKSLGSGGSDLLFVEKLQWIPDLGIHYHVGVDGKSLLVLLMAAILAPIVVAASWNHNDRPRTYFALLSLQFTGLFGAFTALNFFHWFIYWELALVPAFFLIKLFGKGEDRHRAALNFFLFTVIGSVSMLIGFLFLYKQTGTFSFLELAGQAEQAGAVAPWIFCAVLLGLWVKVPLAPLHIWQAPAYAAAPTPVAMLLTGVMSKMGVYAFLRFVPIFPESFKNHGTELMVFALITILWGAFLALRQTDIKRLLAFSSLNHVAFCVLGIGALGVAVEDGHEAFKAYGLVTQGVILQMFAHGITAAGLFYLAGLIEDRSGRRGVGDFGGLCKTTPKLAAAFYLLTFCSLGLPFMAGFAAEFLIFSGSFAAAPFITAMATLGLLATAVFLLTLLQKVFTGPEQDSLRNFPDLTRREVLIAAPLVVLIFWAGIVPDNWLLFSQNLVIELFK